MEDADAVLGEEVCEGGLVVGEGGQLHPHSHLQATPWGGARSQTLFLAIYFFVDLFFAGFLCE